MSTYQWYSQKTTSDLSENAIESLYQKGFVLTRVGRGVMNEVRSLRVDCSRFSLSSENRRVLNKSEFVDCELSLLPYDHYHWSIGKMAFEFYSQKFGEGTMSANKIKEMFCDPERSNMNAVFVYKIHNKAVGYCPVYQTSNIIHYAYPFYVQPQPSASEMRVSGMTMMLQALVFARKTGRKFLYLGSAWDAKASYKLQFAGLEWWDRKQWSSDIPKLKTLLAE